MKLTKNQKELKKKIDMDVKMIFVIRQDLKMGTGKKCSQIGHNTIGLYKKLIKNIKLLDAWESTGQKKIVTKVKTEKEIYNLKIKAEKLNVINHVTYDAGKTQIKSGSLTVIGFIAEGKKLNSFTKNLKLL